MSDVTLDQVCEWVSAAADNVINKAAPVDQREVVDLLNYKKVSPCGEGSYWFGFEYREQGFEIDANSLEADIIATLKDINPRLTFNE